MIFLFLDICRKKWYRGEGGKSKKNGKIRVENAVTRLAHTKSVDFFFLETKIDIYFLPTLLCTFSLTFDYQMKISTYSHVAVVVYSNFLWFIQGHRAATNEIPSKHTFAIAHL